MNILPIIGITWFNGFLLILPLLVIRLGIVKWLYNKRKLKIDHFPPTQNFESISLRGYLILNTLLIFSPLTFHIILENTIIIIVGGILYTTGITFLILSIIHFLKREGLSTKGIYKISRNPMYIGYFLIFISVALLINSLLYLILVVILQIFIHFLILSEERWCEMVYKEVYIEYKNKTRRYI